MAVQIKDLATVKAYHSDRIARFGAQACKALGWKDRDSQLRRFAEFTRLADFSGHSLLDVGCGHGDLYAYLSERQQPVDYTGLDQSEAFLEVALKRYGHAPNTRFLLGEFASTTLPESDYVICCGALNYRSSNPGYVYEMIARLYGACRLGMGVSLLRSVDFADGILAAYDPEPILAFCRQLAPEVSLRQGYGDDDFMVFLYRQQQAH